MMVCRTSSWWQQFFVYLKAKMLSGNRMETTDFETSVKQWEWQWVNSHEEEYPSEPENNPVETVKQLYKKYNFRMQEEYR
jgi:alpha-N-acetylglucosaminidase